MEIIRNRRSPRCFWSSLVVSTFVLGSLFVYISLSFENKYSSASRSAASYSSSPEKLTEECISVCDTEECVHQSHILLENVRATFEPCEDFYKFSCGGFLNKSSPDEDSTFVIRYLNQMRNKLRNILDNLEPNLESASGKMKTVYDSCVQHGSSEKRAVPSMLHTLNSFGVQGWPYLPQDYKFVESNLASVIPNFLLYQEYGFIYFSVGYALRDPDSKFNLTLRISESSYGNKEQAVRKYEVERILKYFQLDSETISEILEESETIHSAIKNLEEESQRICGEEENSTDICESCMECTRKAGDKWRDLCESLESLINISGGDEKVSKYHANIRNNELHFMQNIFHVLGNFSDRSIANYLVINVFLNHLNDLNFYFRLVYQTDPNAHNVVNDRHEPIDRWQYCVEWIANYMPFALAHEFIQKDFTITMLQEVQNLTKEIIEETAESVSHQEWISDAVKKDLSKEVGQIVDVSQVYQIFFPNETIANLLFEGFQPTEGSFLHNIFEYKKYIQVGEMRGLSLSDKMRMLESLFMASASGGDGEISISLGILLPPTYMPRLRRLINLVSLGTIIAHEIGHNVQSFLEIFTTSDQSAEDYYVERQQCLEKQFSQYRFESIGKNLSGRKYSRENEADNMAVLIIDKLINKYVSNGEEISLPALPYSTKQLLYISAAQTWCSVYTKQKEEHVSQSGSHSPANFRLLGMMQNSRGFSEAFSCAEGSYMNPPM